MKKLKRKQLIKGDLFFRFPSDDDKPFSQHVAIYAPENGSLLPLAHACSDNFGKSEGSIRLTGITSKCYRVFRCKDKKLAETAADLAREWAKYMMPLDFEAEEKARKTEWKKYYGKKFIASFFTKSKLLFLSAIALTTLGASSWLISPYLGASTPLISLVGLVLAAVGGLLGIFGLATYTPANSKEAIKAREEEIAVEAVAKAKQKFDPQRALALLNFNNAGVPNPNWYCSSFIVDAYQAAKAQLVLDKRSTWDETVAQSLYEQALPNCLKITSDVMPKTLLYSLLSQPDLWEEVGTFQQPKQAYSEKKELQFNSEKQQIFEAAVQLRARRKALINQESRTKLANLPLEFAAYNLSKTDNTNLSSTHSGKSSLHIDNRP